MPKKREIILSPEAQSDLETVYDPLYSAIRKRLLLLTDFPLMGKALPGRFTGWRATPVGMFLIIYRPIEIGIEVAYVRHCKRKPPTSPFPK